MDEREKSRVRGITAKYKRDRCYLCGKNYNLHNHHISYSGKKEDCVTLCSKCHSRLHALLRGKIRLHDYPKEKEVRIVRDKNMIIMEHVFGKSEIPIPLLKEVKRELANMVVEDIDRLIEGK